MVVMITNLAMVVIILVMAVASSCRLEETPATRIALLPPRRSPSAPALHTRKRQYVLCNMLWVARKERGFSTRFAPFDGSV